MCVTPPINALHGLLRKYSKLKNTLSFICPQSPILQVRIYLTPHTTPQQCSTILDVQKHFHKSNQTVCSEYCVATLLDLRSYTQCHSLPRSIPSSYLSRQSFNHFRPRLPRECLPLVHPLIQLFLAACLSIGNTNSTLKHAYGPWLGTFGRSKCRNKRNHLSHRKNDFIDLYKLAA